MKWATTASVLMMIVGALAILLSAASELAATIVVGVLILFGGVLHIAPAWCSAHCGAIAGELFLGLVYGVAGPGLRRVRAVATAKISARAESSTPRGDAPPSRRNRDPPGRRVRCARRVPVNGPLAPQNSQ